jgi:hypothetical protein
MGISTDLQHLETMMSNIMPHKYIYTLTTLYSICLCLKKTQYTT